MRAYYWLDPHALNDVPAGETDRLGYAEGVPGLYDRAIFRRNESQLMLKVVATNADRLLDRINPPLRDVFDKPSETPGIAVRHVERSGMEAVKWMLGASPEFCVRGIT